MDVLDFKTDSKPNEVARPCLPHTDAHAKRNATRIANYIA